MATTPTFTAELTDKLCEFVRHVVKWHSGGSSDGVRLDGETLAQMYERFGRADEVPEPPHVPECVEHVVQWFFELSARRIPAAAGIAPLLFETVEAWIRLTGTIVTSDEVGMLMAMDTAYRSAANEKPEQKNPATSGMFGKKAARAK